VYIYASQEDCQIGQLHLHPDPITRNVMAAERRAAIAALNYDFTNRDVRYIMTGGAPRDPGIHPYVASSHLEHYVNRLLFPQLLIKVFYTVDHETFYSLVEEFAVPYLQAGGQLGGAGKPHRMTPDALMALLLLMCHENTSDSLLAWSS
jgi:hypothetical protein